MWYRVVRQRTGSNIGQFRCERCSTGSVSKLNLWYLLIYIHVSELVGDGGHVELTTDVRQ
jgi:hypothetical protein